MSMMDFNFAIPYWVLLIPYALVMSLLIFFGVMNLFHLLRYGFFSPVAIGMTFFLIAGTIFLLMVSYYLLSPIDWSQELTIKDTINSLNPL
jgi:hypothetical protein